MIGQTCPRCLGNLNPIKWCFQQSAVFDTNIIPDLSGHYHIGVDLFQNSSECKMCSRFIVAGHSTRLNNNEVVCAPLTAAEAIREALFKFRNVHSCAILGVLIAAENKSVLLFRNNPTGGQAVLALWICYILWCLDLPHSQICRAPSDCFHGY